jgi:hypothetical protein
VHGARGLRGQLVGRRQRHQPRRVFDAEGGLRGPDPGVRQDAGGQGRHVHPVVRRLRRPEPRGRERPSGGRRRVLARAGRGAPRGRRDRRPELERRPDQGDGHRLGRRPRGPQGQPEGHQVVRGPRQAGCRGHHAEPVHVGRRALERDGDLRQPDRAGQDRAAGRGLPGLGVRERRRPGQGRARLAPDVRRRQGRRTDRLRERGDRGPAEGDRPRLRDPRPDDPDREPDRGHQAGQRSREGEGVRRLPRVARGAEDLRLEGLPAGRREPRRREAVPDPQAAVRHHQVRRLGHGQRQVLRSGQGRDGRDRGEAGGLDWRRPRQHSRSPRAGSADPAAAASRAGSRWAT